MSYKEITMNNFQVILTVVCLVGLATIPILLSENSEKQDSSLYDCQDPVSIPIVERISFVLCPDNNSVWTGNEWTEPTNFEQRRIDNYHEAKILKQQQRKEVNYLNAILY